MSIQGRDEAAFARDVGLAEASVVIRKWYSWKTNHKEGGAKLRDRYTRRAGWVDPDDDEHFYEWPLVEIDGGYGRRVDLPPKEKRVATVLSRVHAAAAGSVYPDFGFPPETLPALLFAPAEDLQFHWEELAGLLLAIIHEEHEEEPWTAAQALILLMQAQRLLPDMRLPSTQRYRLTLAAVAQACPSLPRVLVDLIWSFVPHPRVTKDVLLACDHLWADSQHDEQERPCDTHLMNLFKRVCPRDGSTFDQYDRHWCAHSCGELWAHPMADCFDTIALSPPRATPRFRVIARPRVSKGTVCVLQGVASLPMPRPDVLVYSMLESGAASHLPRPPSFEQRGGKWSGQGSDAQAVQFRQSEFFGGPQTKKGTFTRQRLPLGELKVLAEQHTGVGSNVYVLHGHAFDGAAVLAVVNTATAVVIWAIAR